jgi:D-arabinose 1-dehydrogenase-like Zn-dependent alcohol dehydrogenase
MTASRRPVPSLRHHTLKQGRASGTATDSAATAFAVKHGIRAMLDRFPPARAGRALESMKSGSVRFRAVLDVGRDGQEFDLLIC